MLIHLTLLLCCSVATAQKVKTSLGEIQGFEHTTTKGVVAEVFLGIPFVKPPVGELRYELPVELDAFPVPLLNASAFGAWCIPHIEAGDPYGLSDENCLTLNVIRPKTPAAKPRPVLVWVHGGGFELLSAHYFGYQTFAEFYIPADFIVVTFQYRLGVYGFLHGGDVDANLGLYDMTAALKFVNKHIGDFGGDKDAVTLWGLSAGGCAVAQLGLSPMSRDLFRAQIQMSGSPHTAWGYGPTVNKNTLDLFKALGCPEGNGAKACMKKKTKKEIYDAVLKIGYTTKDMTPIKWGPVIDGKFLPDTPDNLLKTAPKKPTLMGVSNKEGAYFALMGIAPEVHGFAQPSEVLLTYKRADIEEIFNNLIGVPKLYGANTDKVLAEIEEFYLGDKNVERSNGFYLDGYSRFVSDYMFIVPAVREAYLKRSLNIPTYVYSFNHYNPEIWNGTNLPVEVQGSVHTNEFMYFLGHPPIKPFTLNQADYFIAKKLISAIITFGKYMVPMIADEEWKPFGEEANFFCFAMNSTFTTDFYGDSYRFWTSLKDNYGFDAITMTSNSK